MNVSEKDHQAIAAVIDEHHAGWDTMNASRLLSIWKEDEGDLIYTAVEMPLAIRDLNTIKKYLDRAVEECEPPKKQIIDISSIEIVGNIAIVYLNWHYEFCFKGKPPIPHLKPHELITAKGRTTMVMRRTADGWKLMHYHESKNGERHDPLK